MCNLEDLHQVLPKYGSLTSVFSHDCHCNMHVFRKYNAFNASLGKSQYTAVDIMEVILDKEEKQAGTSSSPSNQNVCKHQQGAFEGSISSTGKL